MTSSLLPKTLPSEAIFTVKLTRVAPRKLDSQDNARSAMKHVVDGISDAIGVDDGSDRYTWLYDQEKSKEYGVKVTIIIDVKPAKE